jgi:hypothetical protein
MQPNALLAWQSFMMQKVGVTLGVKIGVGALVIVRIVP